MGPRTRILDAAMLVFRRQGFRRSSIEQAAEAAGLTRQALYHHFKSKEALFRAVIERLHESALAAEIEAANVAEKAGGSLADILVASVSAKLSQLAESLDGSPHVEELFSEHLLQARDLYQKYAAAYGAQLAATITRVCRNHGLTLNAGMTPRDFARCIEMAINGTRVCLPRDAAGRRLPEGSGRSCCAHSSPAPLVRRRGHAPVKRHLSGKSLSIIARSTPRKPGDRR
jgi:TetR/AcrR family acrAB operon transcriptional repressor